MFRADKDFQCREIITKAVCGKGRKFSKTPHTITLANRPSSILGSWAINHTFEAEKVGDMVEIVGKHEISLWYSYANNTKTTVATETVSYMVQVPLSYLDSNCKNEVEVTAQSTQGPTCIDAKITGSGDAVEVLVEKEFLVEIVGETKVCVVLCPGDCDDEDKGFLIDEEDIESEDIEDLDPFIIDDLD